MANTIITKNSATATAVPTAGQLVQGELAVNVTDKRLFTENSGGTVVELGTNPSQVTTGGLTVDGTAIVQSAEPRFILGETDVIGKNTRFRNTGGQLQIQTIDDAYFSATNRILLDHATGDISFYEDTGTTAKMVWDASAESLGIGTSSPDSKLEVAGPDETQIKVTGASGVEAVLRASASTVTVGSNTAHNLYLRTNNSARMTIESGGNVGIGTISPDYALDLEQSNTGIHALRIRNTNSGSGATGRILFHNDQSTNVVQSFIQQKSSSDPSYANALLMGSTFAHPVVFFTSSAERMRLDSSGNLGLGVEPSGWASTFKSLDIQTNGISVTSTGTADARIYANAYYNGTSWIYKGGSYASGYQQSNSAHKWYTAPSGSAGGAISFTQAMTLTAAGNLGVGTTLAGNAANKLTIRKDNVNNVVDALLLNNGSVNNQASTGVRINMSGVSEANSDIRYAYIEAATTTSGNDHYLAFGTNASVSAPTERARIDSSGNLGLGVAPSAWRTSERVFEFGTSGAFGAYGSLSQISNAIKFYNNTYYNSSNTPIYINSDEACGLTLQDGAFKWFTAPSGTAGATIPFTQAMTLDASGSLLVSPTSNDNSANNLYVMGSQSYTSSASTLATSATKAAVRFRGATDTSNSIYFGALTNGDQYLQGANYSGGGAVNIAINPFGGNLLVGKLSSSFSTDGIELQAGGTVQVTNTSAKALNLNRLSTDGAIVEFYKDGTTVGSIGNFGDNLGIESVDVGLLFLSGSAQIVPTGGNYGVSDGTKDLGRSATRFKNLYLSGGVYVGGTAAANKLDDYEEGTWDFGLAGGTSAGTFSVAAREGSYVKVGRTVSISGYIWATSFTGTGDFLITGLPFAVASESLFSIQVNTTPWASLPSDSQHIAGITGSAFATKVGIRATSRLNGGTSTTAQCSGSGSVTFLRIAGTYYTND